MSGVYYAVAMAGQGKRFSSAGYVLPKFMIEAAGRTLFEHSVFSLPLHLAAKIIFIALREHEEKYGLRNFIEAKLAGALPPGAGWELLLLDAPTGGQAETVLAAKDLVPAGADLAIYNIDTRFNSPALAARLADPAAKLDGVLGGFKLSGQDAKWSFAALGPDGLVTRTAEKQQISDNALTGFYHFTRAGDFFQAAEEGLAAGPGQGGEHYVAPLYNRLIARGRRFTLDLAPELTPLGTPLDVERLAANG